jgi:hypothetical protein
MRAPGRCARSRRCSASHPGSHPRRRGMKRGRGGMKRGARLVCNCIKRNHNGDPGGLATVEGAAELVNKMALSPKRCMLRVHSVDIRTSSAVFFAPISQDCVRKTLVFERRRGVFSRGFTNLHGWRGFLVNALLPGRAVGVFVSPYFSPGSCCQAAQVLAGPGIKNSSAKGSPSHDLEVGNTKSRRQRALG